MKNARIIIDSSTLELLNKLSQTIDKWVSNREYINEEIFNSFLLIGIINLDLATALRIYSNSKTPYEAIYSVRECLAIANEGYKRLYHFTNLPKKRKETIWIKNISPLIEQCNNQKLIDKYNCITEMLNRYEPIVSQFKDARDYSIHYDENGLKVYDMIIELRNIDEEMKKIIPFHNIMTAIHELTSNLFIETVEKYGNSK